MVYSEGFDEDATVGQSIQLGVSDAPGDTFLIVPRSGQSVVVFSDLRLTTAAPSPITLEAQKALISRLTSWSFEGHIVIAGNLFDPQSDPEFELKGVLDANAEIFDALRAITEDSQVEVTCLGGSLDKELLSSSATRSLLSHRCQMRFANAVEVLAKEERQIRRVLISPFPGGFGNGDSTAAGGSGGFEYFMSGILRRLSESSKVLRGAERLGNYQEISAFVVSRFLYRRATRYLALALIPLVASFLIKLPFLLSLPVVSRLRATRLLLGHRLLLVGTTTILDAVIVALVTLVASRRLFSTLDRATEALFGGADQTSRLHSSAATLSTRGYGGLITSGDLKPHLASVGDFFIANVGGITYAIERVRARLGLPDTFVEARQATWVELEMGATLRVRLAGVDGEVRLHGLVRLLGVPSIPPGGQGGVLGSFPHGTEYPPPRSTELRRTLLVRRIGYVVLLTLGVIDLISSFTPPLRSRLHLLLELFPNIVPTYANALSAVTGVLILALASGIRRGQRSAWVLTMAVTAFGAVVNIIKGGDVEEALLLLGVFVYLGANRRAFSRSEVQQGRIARTLTFAGVAVAVLVVGVATLEVYLAITHSHFLYIGRATAAVAERMVGVSSVPLPHTLSRLLDPALFLAGLTLIGALALSLVNPYISALRRTLRTSNQGTSDPYQIVARHSTGTLDYFALRDDKEHFMDSGTLIAYGEYGSTCIVSPDPVGPEGLAPRVFSAFMTKVKAEGKSVAILGADERWLATYRQLGLRSYYIGDEAIVELAKLSLEGKAHKSLRQAVNRMKKYGYLVEFVDPLELGPRDVEDINRVLTESRRGGVERGFSMTLGRMFDPRDKGLLLSICRGPDKRVVGFCQWVPAPGIMGYSLDIMRREIGEHPNGLIDLLIVDTIHHLRDQGHQAISLNFAAMRATLAGERGDSLPKRVERWVLKRLSDSMQIESLWRFNAKFDPRWEARYLIYDNPEDLPNVVVAVARAESLWEIPLVGRFLSSSNR